MRRQLLLTTIGALLLAGGAFAQHGPHEHGAVKLDVVVEPGRVTLLMESPLENLVGFERAPRSAAERQRVAAALSSLNSAATLFKIDPAAACTPGPVELNAAALELGKPAAVQAEAEPGHADLDASFSFKCNAAPLPAFVDIGLFSAFPGVHRIDVQLVTGNTQSKRTLTRPTARLSLTR
jgi:hypothetical protein